MLELNTETLMAYVDGELGATEAAAVEAALAADSGARAQVEQLRSLNLRVRAAFSHELSDAVPAGLLAQAHGQHLQAPPAPVTPLPIAARRPWLHWMGLAASVLFVAWGWQHWGLGSEDQAWRTGSDGQVQASASLQRALEDQLALQTGPAGVKVAWSFKDRDGRYCRAFEARNGAGLACREAGQWQLVVLTPISLPAERADPSLRLAASGLPAAVLEAAERRMAGIALDATQERAARDTGWRR